MKRIAALALLLLAACARAEESDWQALDSVHFVVHYQGALSLGEHNRIDRIYESLDRELGALAPWMSVEKTHVYLYKNQAAYQAGRFNPPSWSRALFSVPEKAVALYEPAEPAVLAHELTHLYFHSFFEEKGAEPPAWLDEGLAVLLEGEALTPPDPNEKGPVLRAVLPVAALLKASPRKDTPQDRVSAWYQQAHSTVRFLKRGHIEDSFVEYCARLRGGESAEDALRKVYDYQDAEAFAAAWGRWRPK